MKNLLLIMIACMFSPCYAYQNKEAVHQKEQGSVYNQQGDYFKSLEHYFKALDLFRKAGDVVNAHKVTNNIGNTYSNAGFHKMALNFYIDAFEARKKLNDVEGIAKVYYNIGRSYEKSFESKQARKYLFLADSLFKKLAIDKYADRIYNEIGITYWNDSNYVKAREYYSKVLNTKNQDLKANIINNIGYSYHSQGQDDKAYEYYLKVLNENLKIAPLTRTLIYQNIADISENKDSIAWYYDQGFDKDLIWINEHYLNASNAMYHYQVSKDNIDSASYYHQIEHEAAKRAVKQRDEMKRLFDLYQVKTAHFKRQVQQQAAISETHRLYKWLMSGGAIVLMIIFGIVYYYKRKTLENDIDNNRFVI